MMALYPLLLLITGGVLLTIADIIMKKWVESENLSAFWLGMLIYMAGMALLAHSFKFKNIAVASMIFVIFNIVTLAIASHILFQEKLQIQQLIGIGFGLVAVGILEMPE
jgi:multidrug transporter EmrE-like cation transporter